MVAKDEQDGSRQMFGECELGDARRTERLVNVAARMSKQMGKSLAKRGSVALGVTDDRAGGWCATTNCAGASRMTTRHSAIALAV